MKTLHVIVPKKFGKDVGFNVVDNFSDEIKKILGAAVNSQHPMQVLFLETEEPYVSYDGRAYYGDDIFILATHLNQLAGLWAVWDYLKKTPLKSKDKLFTLEYDKIPELIRHHFFKNKPVIFPGNELKIQVWNVTNNRAELMTFDEFLELTE